MFISVSDGVTRILTSAEERFAPADILKVRAGTSVMNLNGWFFQIN